jgi:hypothetical protein
MLRLIRSLCCPTSTRRALPSPADVGTTPKPWGESARGSKLIDSIARIGGTELVVADQRVEQIGVKLDIGDLERYTKPASIWAALMTGNVRLLRASWLVVHGKAGGILARRQDLPDEAFIGVEELQRMFGEGNGDDVLPIIAISFCWAIPAHPDPDDSQLRTIVEVLEREMEKYVTANNSFVDMGIFWDVCCLIIQTYTEVSDGGKPDALIVPPVRWVPHSW